MRLTNAMLEAILIALCELEAEGTPQGCDNDKEAERIMENCAKAKEWVDYERDRRAARSPKRNQEP